MHLPGIIIKIITILNKTSTIFMKQLLLLLLFQKLVYVGFVGWEAIINIFYSSNLYIILYYILYYIILYLYILLVIIIIIIKVSLCCFGMVYNNIKIEPRLLLS